MVILKLAGRSYSQIKKEMDEVIQLDDITINWKLVGSISSQIIPGSIKNK